ncbi:MAG: MFS transporter [Candidatus Micrarchaeota archaeon]
MHVLKDKNFLPALTINYLHSFLSSAMAILLPIYLLDKNIKIQEIGLIFATLPFMMLFLRLVLASIADSIGTKLIFMIEGVASILYLITYKFANSPSDFVLGKISEGTAVSSFWAVNRTQIAELDHKTEISKIASFFVGLRSFGEFCGNFVTGLGIVYLGFSNMYLLLFGIGLVVLISTILLKNNKNQNSELKIRSIIKKIFVKKEISFWKNSLVLGLFGAVQTILVTFLLPVYFYAQIKLSPFEIGGFMSMIPLISALTIIVLLKLKATPNQMIILSALFSIPALFLYTTASKDLMFAATMLYSVAAGSMSIIYEMILISALDKKETFSTDIGLLHIPIRLAETVILGVSGFLVVSLGYATMFVIAGVFLICYFFASLIVLRKHTSF